MPVKYIGRKTDFKGKTLWQILGNLKNYGVGRMVVRSKFQEYPEPSYMRILKVAAVPMIGESNPDNMRKVIALVEKTFRGQKFTKPSQLDAVTYKSDYVLIPKDQESRYTNVICEKPVKILPRQIEFPPLLKEILIRQRKRTGQEITEDIKLQARYNFNGLKNQRIAEEQETPTIDFQKTAQPTLYITTGDEQTNQL
ncbi:mitochondrial ribosomal protein S34 [Nomia melanderi]|uniref:mitochondrial ribosomal protein S34 n=1 Tax=Nomia melanderi TaxID=2448451 RepID=UPI00130452A7|nr:uncharacterized protein LOC116432759 [Nomia melanderi]